MKDMRKLPSGGMDTHVHLDGGKFRKDLGGVVERATACGVDAMCNVFLSAADYRKGAEAMGDIPGMVFALGIHPHRADKADKAELDAIEDIARSDTRVRAIGEIGLDFYRDIRPRPEQKQAFIRQLDMARRLDLPVVIHARDAEETAVRMLVKHGFSDRPVLFHAWCAGPGVTDMALENQKWVISLGGASTYQSNGQLRAAIPGIPPERLVFETDCPYLVPEPYRKGVRRNEPAYAAATCVAVSEMVGVHPDDLWVMAGRTAARFFGHRMGG